MVGAFQAALVLCADLINDLYISMKPPVKKVLVSNAGFTLIEVIVGMLIFSLVVAGAMLSMGKGYEFMDATRQHSRASQVLQSEIELIRTMPWGTFDSITDTTLTTWFQQQINEQFGAGTFTGEVVTTEPQTDLKFITVTVKWTGIKGTDYSMNYYTYMTEGGVNDYYITP